MPFFSYLTDRAMIADVFLRRPETYLPLTRFTQAILRGPSPFTVAERELIAAYVSGVNACRFCRGTHTAIAAAFGVDRGLIDRLIDAPDTAPADDRLKPVLAFVRKLTETPARMTRADAEAVFAAGWDEDALHDAIAVCALFNFFNRLVEGHGIKGRDDVFAKVAGFIKTHGYDERLREPIAAKGDDQA